MLRTIIVDESRIFREIFREELFKHFPFMSIHEAINGEEAIKKIYSLSPSLIFMDICLPGLNGLQLTQRIKKEFPNIRVAILTGYDLPDYRRAAMQNGADAFFTKDRVKWSEIEGLLKPINQQIFSKQRLIRRIFPKKWLQNFGNRYTPLS